jgi:hypothetical protein
MKRKCLWIIPLLLLSTAIGSTTARADSFDYTISGADSGNIDITETGGVITAVSGTFDGATINGLLPTGSIGNNDNDYFPGTTIFDEQGVSFNLDAPDSDGNQYINLFAVEVGTYETYQGNTNDESSEGDSYHALDALTPDTSSVPELNPTSGTSAIVLLACAVLIIRGRRSKTEPESERA